MHLLARCQNGVPDVGISPPKKARIVAQVDGATSLMAAVEAGQGIAFGPPTYAMMAGKRAKYLPISPPAPPIVLGVIMRAGAHAPLLEAFLQALRLAAKG